MKKSLVSFAALVCVLTLLGQPPDPQRSEFTKRLVAAAVARAAVHVRYDPAYVRIPYPNGDVPAGTGVCTDEIIRIYRQVGIDLQQEVHKDIQRHFGDYPRRMKQPDSNIDHRRVPNLMVFFRRYGQDLPITRNPNDYLPGDIVAWNLGGKVTHIGMVVDQKNVFGQRYKILHNIGAGPQIEDVLFEWKIIGHYRYYGPAKTPRA